MTALISQYEKTKNCHTGEVGDYGYAFIHGSNEGIVLLDLKTKNFLDNFVEMDDLSNTQQRLSLLFKNKLIQKKEEVNRDFNFSKNKVKTISIWLHVSNKCNNEYSMRASFSLDGVKDWHNKMRSFKNKRGNY